MSKLNREDIKKILPHREPMLLIDNIEKVSDTVVIGTYTVRGDEWFLQGHFPDMPVLPGVIQCEMLAQTCCLLYADVLLEENKTPFFASLEKVRFKNKVVTGDTMIMECSLIKSRCHFYFAKGIARVNGKISISAELSFAII